PRPAGQLLPELPQRLPAARQEAEELVPLRRETARDERGLDRRRAGEHRHGQTRLERRTDEAGTRVAHSGETRVRDERHSLAGLEPWQQLRRPRRLVV